VTTRIQLDLSFAGKSPIVSGDKRLTMLNLDRLLRAINHGSHYRLGSTGPVVKVIPTIVAASATVTMATPTTGQTVTIAGTAMTAQQSRARATCTASTVLANDTVTVNGVVFTAVNGAVVLGEATFDCSGSNTACAASLSAQLNAYVSPKISGLVTSKSASAVCTVIAQAEGTSGNAITLVSSSGSTLAVTGSGFLAGGAAVANNKFDFGSTNDQVAASFARAVNASTTAAIRRVTAVAASAVVTLTAKIGGAAGNAITLTSSDGSTLAVTGSGFLASGSQGEPVVFNF